MSNERDTTYPTPVGGSKTAFIERSLETKANRDWTEAKLEAVELQVGNLKSELDETKKIALGARKKAGMPHECNQRELIEKTAVAVDGWSKWWRGILISVIGFLIVVGSSWLYQYFTLTNDVETTRQSVEELKVTVKKIETSQEDLKRAFDNSNKEQKKQAEDHISSVRKVMREILTEVRDDDFNNRRRGG